MCKVFQGTCQDFSCTIYSRFRFDASPFKRCAVSSIRIARPAVYSIRQLALLLCLFSFNRVLYINQRDLRLFERFFETAVGKKKSLTLGFRYSIDRHNIF